MIRGKKIERILIAIVAASSVLVDVPVVGGALDIDRIGIMTELEHVDGLPDGAYPWDFEIDVFVSDPGALHHIDVTNPGASSVSETIYETEPGLWAFDPPKDSSLEDLRLNYPEGTYTLEFRDSGNTLLKTVYLDYSGLSAPASVVDFTYPSWNGQTGVSTNPTFMWTIAADAGDSLAPGIDDEDTGEQVYGALVSMTTLSWSTGPLLPNHEYHLDVTVSEVKNWVGPDLPPTMTVGDDEFTYYLTFDYINTISFTTSDMPPEDYSFYLDRFEVSGNVPVSLVDEFNDGSVSPWVIHDPTVEESGGFVSFSSPGTIEAGVLDGFPYLIEMSFIGSGYPSQFVVENGKGDFTGISRWKPIIPGVNQWYEMQVGYELQQEPHIGIDISVGVANWDSEFAGILGIPSGLGISFYLSGDSLVWKHILISEDDLTNANAILLKLDFFDDTDEFRAGFSLDGGANYQYFPELIGWDQPTPGHYEWYFSGQAIELQDIPTPHPADKDGDYVIDDFELLDHIDLWAEGQVDDFDLLDTIDLWAAGHY